MKQHSLNRLLTVIIAVVWLVNGVICKVLDLVPRHRQIVARILGEEYAPILTTLIGIAEIAMAVWVLSRFWPRLNAITQISVIALMNVIEFILAPDLLLWGRVNAIFALAFIALIFYNEFVLRTIRPTT